METKSESHIRKVGRGVAWVLVFLVAFIAVKYVKQAWFEQRAIEKASADLAEMRADAVKDRPDLPPAQAFQETAVKQMTEKLASQAGDKQAETAADMYWGFLFVNTRMRVTFCKELGVDIAPFARTFENLHANETAKARAIYARLSPVDEDEVYEKFKGQFRKTIEDDMTEMASAENISTRAVCRLFSEHGEEFAKEMLLSKVNPALYQALRAAR